MDATETLLVEKGAEGGIQYPHTAPRRRPAGLQARDARLSNSDWLAQVSIPRAKASRSHHRAARESVQLLRGAARETCASVSPPGPRCCPTGRITRDSRVPLTLDGRPTRYLPTAPPGLGHHGAVLHLPAGSRYFSVAACRTIARQRSVTSRRRLCLPDGQRVDGVRRAGQHREDDLRSRNRGQGVEPTTFMGLYPHQWKNASSPPASKYSTGPCEARSG